MPAPLKEAGLHPLASPHQHTVAMELTNELFDSYPEDKTVVDLARNVRDTIWRNAPPKNARETAQRETDRDMVFEAAFKHLDKYPEQRATFLEIYARMGHLYEAAGLIARENLFNMLRNENKPLPGGIRDTLTSMRKKAGGDLDVDTAVAQFNKPEFEIVMTAHPTNVNAPEYIRTMRDVARAVDEFNDSTRKGDLHKTEGYERAIKRLCHTSVIHQKKQRQTDGKEIAEDANLTVVDEARLMLNFMKNIYNDLPSVYKRFDETLADDTKGGFGKAYDPTTLNLNIKLASWGSSGDKDGNPNVNADTTLTAIALHKHDIIEAYKDSLGEINLEGLPALTKWKERLTASQGVLDNQLSRLSRIREEGRKLSTKEFAEISQKVAGEFNDLEGEKKQFVQDLSAAYKEATNEGHRDAAEILNLKRRAQLFGFGFGRIEYRETAEEYTRVVAEIIPGYDKLDEDAKVQKLTEILQKPGEAEKLLNKVRKRIEQQGHGKEYDKDNAAPIAYNTIKRMELARDNPGMITDNVLAECQHTSNLLEAVFLQAATAKDGKRAALGVIPLFEERDSLVAAPQTLKKAYANEAYRDHLRLVARTRAEVRGTEPEITQQVQIAHSDNTRRAGLPAARAYIDEAHEAIRRANNEAVIDGKPVKTEFFEGGSASDALRGGTRAITAAVNNYGLFDKAKFTFQGGDLTNYFNDPDSIERLFARIPAHMAEKSFGNGTHEGDHTKRVTSDSYNLVSDHVARKALQATYEDYRTVFTSDNIGMLCAQLGVGNTREAKAAGKGSRAERPGVKPVTAAVAFAKVESTGMGAVQTTVDPTKIRTITFSELLQHGGLVPTWVGSKTLLSNLQENIDNVTNLPGLPEGAKKKEDLGKFVARFPKGKDITPAQIKTLYDESPVFRDVMDRMAFGIAMTDMDALETLNPGLRKNNAAFMDRLQDEYNGTARLVYAARTGKLPKGCKSLTPDREEVNNHDLRSAVIGNLSHIRMLVEDKCNYRDFLLHAKDRWREDDAMQQNKHADNIVHSAIDTVMHGRFLPADDVAYGKALTTHFPHLYNGEAHSIAV